LKKYILFISLLLGTVTSKAQIDVNYAPYGVGVGFSSVLAFADLKIQQSHFAEYANFTYYITGYIPLAFEVQKGTLSGTSDPLDVSGRFYTNNYMAFGVHGDFQLGQLMQDSGLLGNFYLGTGVGLISNNNVVQRTGNNGYIYPGQDKSLELMVPIRFGYEYKILNSFGEPFIRIDLGYVHNLTYGEGLDGYADPAKGFKNNSQDQFRQISLGIKLDFGGGN